MTASKTVLYSYWKSSCAWRVRTALAWKQIPFEYKAIDISKQSGAQFSDEYTKLNPHQRVPALAIDGHVLCQSGAILEYLDETRPERPLLPKDPFLRAQVRNICLVINADIQPLQTVRATYKSAEPYPESEREEKVLDWGRFWVQRGFVALEKELATTAGTYCVGDEVTMADIFLAPQVYNAGLFGVDMARFPVISRVAEALSKLPEFENGSPANQPDAK